MRTAIRIATVALLALGCNVRYSSSSSSNPQPVTDPNAGKPVETAEPAGKPIDKPDPEAEKQAKAKAEYDAAIKEADAAAAKEAERWTPELRASTAKLTARKWSSTKQALTAALASPHRVPGNAARDNDRHPVKTMEFFGLKPTMTVFEVGPGGGWWTELLAVVLAAKGKLVLASFDPKSDDLRTAYYAHSIELLLGKSTELFGKVETVKSPGPGTYDLGPADSLDMVLMMRASHNLAGSGNLDKLLAAAHTSLKPGGILAIEQHRAADGADPKQSAEKGYLPEKWVIEQVEAAGFKLEKKSEINANAKDTKDYPQGVWTLPPSFAEGDKDKAKYEAVGESDRMTLKFVKPRTRGGKPAAPAGPGLTPTRTPTAPTAETPAADTGKMVAPKKAADAPAGKTATTTVGTETGTGKAVK
ncbi:MAG: class I SAM-dependent methyltransferase [Deltaproteobacteria bacterium]|nr:class I SAM-dependent methyltransferase [Nannocystaceae bacterium]